MIITILICVAAVIAYMLTFRYLNEWVHGKYVAAVMAEKPVAECEWTPRYKLEHRGLQVYNIPFVPEPNEVFYIENEYDEDANLFIQENMDLIKQLLATKGLTFVYLPMISVSKEMAEAMLTYYTANPSNSIDDDNYEKGLKSSFLLDYMLHPENRCKIATSFCWYNTSTGPLGYKQGWHIFDYISFDGKEARQHPREVIEDMLPELGGSKIWRNGVYCSVEVKSAGIADDNFDEETKKILSEIQEKLNAVRLKGISEAIIAQYVKACPKISRMTISSTFAITLNDYDNTEITMEPIVKAVFILFLRHEEGIKFKNLADYQNELEIIYRAVKAKKNDIDAKIQAGFTPQISNSVQSLTNPMSNSINEKCTRIKEAFLVHFHDSIASNYYIQGLRANAKTISLPRKLVNWED